MGEEPAEEAIGVDGLNALPDGAAMQVLQACCPATAWVAQMLAGRPYASAADVYTQSDRATAGLDDAGFREALAGHPRIGERLEDDGAHAAASRREQATVAGADAAALQALAEGNARYEQRFGHVYLVNAAGRDAAELLAVLQRRLGNDPATERAEAGRELAAINANRLERVLG